MKSRAKSGSVKQWLGASALSMSALAWLPSSIASAAEANNTQQRAPFSFAIAAKPLPQALSDFSRATGISVVYTDEAPYGLTAPAINGHFSAEQAMQRLLSGSGFTLRRTDAQTLMLEPVPTAGTLNLGATTITSVADQSMSYQPPPTSSVMRSSALPQEIPQTVNVAPAQVIRDQLPRNLDDALPSYAVADAFATYDTQVEGQRVKFQLNVKNLFDRTYYTSAASRFFVSMGDSRQVLLSSTLEF